jgi:tight adherence protein C
MKTFPIYRTLMVILLGVTIAGTLFWVSLRPSRPNTRLGLRGLKRQQSLLRPFWGSVEPFVRWMGVRVSPFLSNDQRAKYDAAITYAGDFLGLSPDEYFGMLVACATIGAALGWAIGEFTHARLGVVPMILGAAVIGGIPYMVMDTARTQRFKAINRGLPYAIDLMALSMSAGLDFPGSLQQVVEKSKANEALREELGYLLQQLQLGRTRTQGIREFAARVPIEAVREFAQALIQAEERGNPVASVLEIQAQTARTRRSNQAEKFATEMRARMVLPTMMIIGVGLMLISIPSSMMLERYSEGNFK